MSLFLTRTISATLIAVFGILASAAALCLVPCELAASLPATGTPSLEAHHCSEAPLPVQGGTTLNGVADSCADQHAWEAPAVDRTAPRTSAPALAAWTTTAASVRFRDQPARPGVAATPPASPPLTATPLRI